MNNINSPFGHDDVFGFELTIHLPRQLSIIRIGLMNYYLERLNSPAQSLYLRCPIVV